MSRPKPTVILDDRKYKIYFLKDPRCNIPFYIGLTKTNNRPEYHIFESTVNYKIGNQWKLNTIRKMRETLDPYAGGRFLKGKPWPAARRAAYEKAKAEKERRKCQDPNQP